MRALEALASRLTPVRNSRHATQRFFSRLDTNGRNLRRAYRTLAGDVRSAESLMAGAEWLLDNYHMVEAELLEIQVSLPRSYRDLIIRHIVPSDASVWEAMRRNLWPDGAEEHATEIAMFFAGSLEEPLAILVAECPVGVIVGFVELSIRVDLPGQEGKRVGYVEGLYILPEVRHRGITRRLLRASRNWARQQECTAFASDRADRIIIDRSY